MIKLSFRSILSVLFGLFILAGCDSNNDEDDAEDLLGSFEIEITGDVSQSLDGNQASFGVVTDPQTGITGFGMTLGATGTAANGLSFSRKSGRPGNGNHSIATFDLDTEIETLSDDTFVAIYSTGTDVFYSSGGTLSVTSSSDRRIEGTISMTARSILPTSTAEVTITGTFVAIGLDLSAQ